MNEDADETACIDADGVERPEHDWSGIGPGESGRCPACDAELIDESDE